MTVSVNESIAGGNGTSTIGGGGLTDGRTLADGNDTAVITDNNKLLHYTSTTDHNIIIPDDATAGWASETTVPTITVSIENTGLPTFVASGVTFVAPQGAKAFSTGTIIQAIRTGVNTWDILLSGVKAGVINEYSGTTNTPIAADVGMYSCAKYTSASPVTVTLPTNDAVPIGLMEVINIMQYGAGKVTVAPPATGTLIAKGSLLSTGGQNVIVSAVKIGLPNAWMLIGDRVA
jgi:hypothetical protein